MVVRPPCIHPRPYEKTIKGTAESEGKRERKKITNKVKKHVTSRSRSPFDGEMDDGDGERWRVKTRDRGKDSAIHQPSAGDGTCAAAASRRKKNVWNAGVDTCGGTCVGACVFRVCSLPRGMSRREKESKRKREREKERGQGGEEGE